MAPVIGMSEDLQSFTEEWLPSTEEEREAVRQELSRLLASPELRSSKRYSNFLTFSVEHSLLRRDQSLKERSVGIEVFGRPPDYDTNSDPIVRVTASELRKKISQHYSLPENEREFRILLPAGTYIPVFAKKRDKLSQSIGSDPQSSDKSASLAPTSAPQPAPSVPVAPPSKLRIRIRHWSFMAAVLTVLALSILAIAHLRHAPDSPVDAFWAPVVHSAPAVLLCVPDRPDTEISANNPFKIEAQDDPTRSDLPTVAVSDTLPLVTVANLLHAREKTYRIQGQSSISLADLRQGPTVVIGAFDNRWTLHLTKDLRFHFANDAQLSQFWIEDREHPDFRGWLRTMDEIANRHNYVDYALVARYRDTTTGNETIIAAGLGDAGTQATGDFLSSASLIKQAFESTLGKSRTENIEVVIATDVIGGHAGNPRIIAVASW